MTGISERYAHKIDGILGCFDRMIIGTLPTLCYADGMTSYLSARGMSQWLMRHPAEASERSAESCTRLSRDAM